MTNEQFQCFRQLLAAYRDEYDNTPNRAEWEDFVIESVPLGEHPFKNLSEAAVLRFACAAYDELATFETMSDELATKVRDAESNLNNRKYNFGNF